MADGYRLTAEKVQGRRISRVRVAPLREGDSQGEPVGRRAEQPGRSGRAE